MAYNEIVKPTPAQWHLIVSALLAKGHNVTRGSLAYVSVILARALTFWVFFPILFLLNLPAYLGVAISSSNFSSNLPQPSTTQISPFRNPTSL